LTLNNVLHASSDTADGQPAQLIIKISIQKLLVPVVNARVQAEGILYLLLAS
jgi:hypothetical protein